MDGDGLSGPFLAVPSQEDLRYVGQIPYWALSCHDGRHWLGGSIWGQPRCFVFRIDEIMLDTRTGVAQTCFFLFTTSVQRLWTGGVRPACSLSWFFPDLYHLWLLGFSDRWKDQLVGRRLWEWVVWNLFVDFLLLVMIYINWCSDPIIGFICRISFICSFSSGDINAKDLEKPGSGFAPFGMEEWNAPIPSTCWGIYALANVITSIFLENARKSSKTDREHVIQEELQGKAQYLRDIEMIFAVPWQRKTMRLAGWAEACGRSSVNEQISVKARSVILSGFFVCPTFHGLFGFPWLMLFWVFWLTLAKRFLQEMNRTFAGWRVVVVFPLQICIFLTS